MRDAPEPWHDPEVAAWCAGFLADHGLPGKVRRGLGGEPSVGKRRMAAWLLLQLGRPGVWPAEFLRSDLERAIAKLEELRTKAIEELDFDEELQPDIAELRRLLTEMGKG